MSTKTAQEFKARPGSRIPENKVQAYGQRILDLAKKRGHGVEGVTAEDVVQDAKKKSAPYHEYFEWDDPTAAHQHRLHQARTLLGGIMIDVEIVPGEGPVQVRKFLSNEHITDRGEIVTIYSPQEKVMMDAPKREGVIQRALREALAWKERHGHYRALAAIVDAIDQAVDLEEKG